MSSGSASCPRHVGWSRRELLRAALTASVGLPWLETLAPRVARAQAELPRRFVVMFSPNGTVQRNWAPASEGTEFVLPPILLPLQAHQGDLVIVQGVDQRGAGGDGHQNGMGGMLTGTPLLPGRFAGQGAAPAGWAEGPSVDQRAADVLGRGMPFRSLELAVQPGPADNWGRMIYRGKNRPVPPRDDPARVFDDLFGIGQLEPAEVARRKERRTSVLDHVRGELTRLGSEVSAADRQRLDSHLTQLREVEQRLERIAPSGAACSVPARPGALSASNDAFPNIGALHVDLLVLALACGQTRVASLQWSRSVSAVRFTWLGIADGHHDLSHRPDADTAAQEKLTRINAWYAARFADLITKLKGYEEGEGTLFDRCLLLWCNELGTGNTHSRSDAPYVLAGSAGGTLVTGRSLRYSGDVPHNDLLVAVLNALGIPDATFGKREWCTGAIPGLLA